MKSRFSDRIGVTKPPDTFQINEMNEALRNSLWNLIIMMIHDELSEIDFKKATKHICWVFFKEPVDSLPYHGYENLVWLKKRFYSTGFLWYHVYNLIEFLADNIDSINKTLKPATFIDVINKFLERENSGYRFINGNLAPITSEEEIQAITSAIQKLKDEQLLGASKHLSKAVELLALKPIPDYRNSIKEAISAVESICLVITNNPKATLGDALKTIEGSGKLHPALKEAFLKLYGYTSDEQGIRHAMLEEPNLTQADAKYFLLSCTSFINYLKTKI